jgi:outer membrane protein
LHRFGAAQSLALAAALTASLLAGAAQAETIGGALAKAYLNNPDIGQQRAAVRAADEEIPKADAGYRPTVSAEGGSPLVEESVRQIPQGERPGPIATPNIPKPRGFSLSVNQNLWNGGRTTNLVRRADSRVMAARELLRNTEQNVLMDGVTTYMNVLRDTAILALDRAHVHLLEEQLRETKDRFTAGEVTATDVAQIEAGLAGGQAAAFTAQSTLQTSIGEYRRVIGEQPRRLDPAKPLNEATPKTLDAAIAISQAEHPAIVGLLYGVDAAALEVKVMEGRLYPSVDLKGLIDRRYNIATALTPTVPFTASLTTQATIPVYDGGEAFALTRQAKEQLGQKELQADLQRDKVRAAVVSAWGRNENAVGLLTAAKAQVAARELALTGMREEAKLGQRTSFDELTAEQALLRARIQLVAAQRDQIVASYAVASAIGRLSTANLGLAVTPYDPTVHFNQVKDKWVGLRTPDGR